MTSVRTTLAESLKGLGIPQVSALPHMTAAVSLFEDTLLSFSYSWTKEVCVQAAFKSYEFEPLSLLASKEWEDLGNGLKRRVVYLGVSSGDVRQKPCSKHSFYALETEGGVAIMVTPSLNS